MERDELLVPYEDVETLALVYGRARVLEVESTREGLRFSIEAEARGMSAIRRSRERNQQ
jgi:hypothetical protein